MKIQNYFLTVVLLFSSIITAQVSLGTTSPDSSSLLDLNSTSKGLLTPRMTQEQRDLIPTPAKGLMIFNTDINSLEINRGTTVNKNWTVISNGAATSIHNSVSETGSIITNSTTDVQVLGMSLIPVAGTYLVSFSSQFNNMSESFTSTTSPVYGTEQCTLDLQAAYDEVMAIPVTDATHVPTLGNGERIFPGVYSFITAASITGTLTLDAQGDHNAIFIFKVGGAFAVGAATTMILENGAEARNIFWVSQGSPSIGAACIFKGNIIAHAGAGSIAASTNIDGRMFTMIGALTFGPSIASIPSGISPINLRSLYNFSLFTNDGDITNTATSSITGDLGSNSGEINGLETSIVNGSLFIPSTVIIPTSPITSTVIIDNNNKVKATFSIYQNNILIPSSVKMLISNASAANISLQAIATVDGNQPIEVRWKTGLDTLTMGNRIMTVVKVQ
jgi:hypothetical protein